MNEQEKKFINSIKEKIQKYHIPLTTKQVLGFYSGSFSQTKYNNGRTELVDASIEWHLCRLSSFYLQA